MSKSNIAVHKLRKCQDFLSEVKIFPFFPVLHLVLVAIPGFGGSLRYSLRVGKGMFVLGPGLFCYAQYILYYLTMLCFAISYLVNYLLLDPNLSHEK